MALLPVSRSGGTGCSMGRTLIGTGMVHLQEGPQNQSCVYHLIPCFTHQVRTNQNCRFVFCASSSCQKSIQFLSFSFLCIIHSLYFILLCCAFLVVVIVHPNDETRENCAATRRVGATSRNWFLSYNYKICKSNETIGTFRATFCF